MTLFDDEHRMFQSSVRRFSEQEILPKLKRWEDEKFFPSELFRKLGDNGFLGILIPEADGGVGGDYSLAAAWCEEFGRVPSVGLTVAVNMHSLVITPTLAKFASAAAKEKWLAPAIAGTAIGAYAFTEPGAGSDLTVIQTKAQKDGNAFRLNGSKIFITNGKRAHFVLVLAKTDTEKGYDGYTTFVVDTTSQGFQVARTLDKIGWHCSDTAELVLEDVLVPPEMVLGEVGRGWYQAMSSLEWERLMLALTSIGGAQACLEQTAKYISDRRVFGRTVGSFESNQEMLSMYMSKLAAAQALCHQCVRLLNSKKRCRREVSLAKLFACELAIDIADFCLQLHGGYGYTTEFLPERWLRDLRLNTIGGGTSQIMARIAGKEVFA